MKKLLIFAALVAMPMAASAQLNDLEIKAKDIYGVDVERNCYDKKLLRKLEKDIEQLQDKIEEFYIVEVSSGKSGIYLKDLMKRPPTNMNQQIKEWQQLLTIQNVADDMSPCEN